MTGALHILHNIESVGVFGCNLRFVVVTYKAKRDSPHKLPWRPVVNLILLPSTCYASYF